MAIRSTGIRPIERNGLRGFGLTLTIDNSNSPDTLPVEADSASGAVSSSPASLATHSDDIDLTIPDFLRRTEGGYPKREAAEA